jgi:hypothetical protein
MFPDSEWELVRADWLSVTRKENRSRCTSPARKVLAGSRNGVAKKSERSLRQKTKNFARDPSSFRHAASRPPGVSEGRKFVVTQKGYTGLVPPKPEVGDMVCILLGAQTPFILREDTTQSGKSPPQKEIHLLVGDYYFHGLMHGEATKMGLEERSFALQ